jgi:photosystem II stability/assembly factor-like uncharacterized protein
VLATNNGGKSWETLHDENAGPDASPMTESFTQIAFVNRTNGIALSDKLSGGNLFKTGDGGKTWREIVTTENFRALIFPDAARGFLVSNKNVYSISLKNQK